MPCDHYLPASFIGRFSSTRHGDLSSRPVWVYDAGTGEPVLASARSVGSRHGLYGLTYGGLADMWTHEAELPPVLDALAGGRDVTLGDWVHVAVPFVAALFVAGRECAGRDGPVPLVAALQNTGYLARGKPESRDAAFADTLALVLTARWVVVHDGAHSESLISSDVGFAATQESGSGDPGWAIPLDLDTVLAVFPQATRRLGTFRGTRWCALLDHVEATATAFAGLNAEIARDACGFIVGPTRASVAAHARAVEDPTADGHRTLLESVGAGTALREVQAAHRGDWWYVAGLADLGLPPDQAIHHGVSVDDVDGGRWAPPHAPGTGMRVSPGGIGFAGNEVWLSRDPAGEFDGQVMNAA